MNERTAHSTNKKRALNPIGSMARQAKRYERVVDEVVFFRRTIETLKSANTSRAFWNNQGKGRKIRGRKMSFQRILVTLFFLPGFHSDRSKAFFNLIVQVKNFSTSQSRHDSLLRMTDTRKYRIAPA